MKTLASTRDTAEIVRRLSALRPDSAARWGRMSVGQVVCHMSDACRMALGAMAVSDATGPLERTLVKWIALYAPMPWPSGIVTRPEIDQAGGGGTKPKDFAADIAELIALVQKVAAAEHADWPPHPIFGRMSKAAWLRWGYLHADHHLRQFGA